MKAIYFHPLFDEQKCSYRFSFCLKEALREKGIFLDRPDYRGTGDTSIPFSDVTLETLRQDMESFLAKKIDILIGLRFGASLICDYLSTHNINSCQVILIEPVLTGSEYIDYLSRKQRLKDRLTKMPENFCQEEEFINLGGYKTRKHFIAQIRAFELSGLEQVYLDRHRVTIILTQKRTYSEEKAILSQFEKQDMVKSEQIRFPDFWERIPIMDYSPLTKAIIGCMQ